MIRRLTTESEAFGRLRAEFPAGLVAVVAPDAHSLGLFTRSLRGGLSGRGEPEALDLDLDEEVGWDERQDLAAIQLGPGIDLGLDDVVRSAAEALARLRGVSQLETAAKKLGIEGEDTATPGLSGPRPRSRSGGLGVLEAELRELRADHAEVVGDLEVATMAWLRERQDAETHLQAYRDRARELKSRLNQLQDAGSGAPCPTCSRLLHDRFEPVIEVLREEWESVVQDGSWWKRRREQLDLKPETLQELEGRSLRLQAATEECAERLERARLGVGPAVVSTGAPGDVVEPASQSEPPPSATLSLAMNNVRDRMRVEASARMLMLASRVLTRVTGSDLLGLRTDDEGAIHIEGAGGTVAIPTDEERAVVGVALRIAAGLVLSEDDKGLPGLLVLDEIFDRMEPQNQLRTVDFLRSSLPKLRQVLLISRGDVVDRSPEAFEAVFELRAAHRQADPGSGNGLRPLLSGISQVIFD